MGLIVSLSPVIYQSIEKMEMVLVSVILIFLVFAIFIATKGSVWAGVITKAPQGIAEFPETLGVIGAASLLGAIAFARVGGANDLVQSNYVRDKGLGMGARIPNIVSPITGEEEARLALTTAADLAQSTNSELHVAYVFPTAVQRPFPNPITARPREVQEHELEDAMDQAQQFLDQQVDRVKQEGVSVAEAHLVRGRPDREVVHLSEEIGAGLIILGSRGLGGVRRALMGSVSDSVVRHAHCPVLIVRE